MNKKLDILSIDLYRAFNVLPIPLLHEFSLLQLIFKFHYLKPFLPEAFQDYFVTNSIVHDHQTRNKLNVHLPSVNSNFGKRCSVFRAGQFWSNLPNYLKLKTTYSLFKENVKHFLLYRW